MTFSMKVFLLGLGLGASVAMTSAACDKAGGCKVSDDDVSFMQLSLVQGKADGAGTASNTKLCAESTTNDADFRKCMASESASKSATQPGDEQTDAGDKGVANHALSPPLLHKGLIDNDALLTKVLDYQKVLAEVAEEGVANHALSPPPLHPGPTVCANFMNKLRRYKEQTLYCCTEIPEEVDDVPAGFTFVWDICPQSCLTIYGITRDACQVGSRCHHNKKFLETRGVDRPKPILDWPAHQIPKTKRHWQDDGRDFEKPSTTFTVVGDWGSNGYCAQLDVAVEMAISAKEDESAFVIDVGDHFYNNGIKSKTDPLTTQNWDDVFFTGDHLNVKSESSGEEEGLRSLEVPWYLALGNHDYYSAASAQVGLAETHWQKEYWKMPATYYRKYVDATKFRGGKGKILLIVLDTMDLVGDDDNAWEKPYIPENLKANRKCLRVQEGEYETLNNPNPKKPDKTWKAGDLRTMPNREAKGQSTLCVEHSLIETWNERRDDPAKGCFQMEMTSTETHQKLQMCKHHEQVEQVEKWLKEAFEDEDVVARFVVTHHPLAVGNWQKQLKVRPADAERLQWYFLDMFFKYGVDAVFSGHQHQLELTELSPREGYCEGLKNSMQSSLDETQKLYNADSTKTSPLEKCKHDTIMQVISGAGSKSTDVLEDIVSSIADERARRFISPLNARGFMQCRLQETALGEKHRDIVALNIETVSYEGDVVYGFYNKPIRRQPSLKNTTFWKNGVGVCLSETYCERGSTRPCADPVYVQSLTNEEVIEKCHLTPKVIEVARDFLDDLGVRDGAAQSAAEAHDAGSSDGFFKAAAYLKEQTRLSFHDATPRRVYKMRKEPPTPGTAEQRSEESVPDEKTLERDD